MKKKILISLIVLVCFVSVITCTAETAAPYEGIPKNLKVEVKDLDDSTNLIYCGVDFAIFEDPDEDGIFTVKEDKVKRILTTNTVFALNLGSSKEYKKNVLHKVAMRTLYIAVGTDQHDFVIGGINNGKEGWNELPIIFRPTYYDPTQQTAYIQHTNKWEENRLKYNEAKIANGLDTRRTADMFWSGERFKLEVQTTEIVSNLRASIEGTDYTETLSLSSSTTDGGIYTGTIWEPEMLDLWGNYTPKQLTFLLKVTGEDGTVEEKEVPITIDNRDPYYRIRQGY